MQTLRDQAIAAIVRSRLDEDRDTGGQTIDVTVADGDLFLVGYCDNADQRISAVRIAKGTCGVKTVIDQIRVRATAE
ncbi:MAG: BON domain-containing protein [Armatimonadota bacterium]|jgi:osmotically-inducible protein OsmY